MVGLIVMHLVLMNIFVCLASSSFVNDEVLDFCQELSHIMMI